MTATFGIFFAILVVNALIGQRCELVMRIRLTKREPIDKIAWWRRGGDEVEAAYEELFPKALFHFSGASVSGWS
jgi:hypothetical protein